jgi:hypothetical protein
MSEAASPLNTEDNPPGTIEYDLALIHAEAHSRNHAFCCLRRGWGLGVRSLVT